MSVAYLVAMEKCNKINEVELIEGTTPPGKVRRGTQASAVDNRL
jgi:hypothetical protein